jgi:hypothetical protein
VQTPVINGLALSSGLLEEKQYSVLAYREAIGGLGWKAPMTTPDVAFAYILLGQFNE